MSSQKESEFLRSERRMSFEGCSSIPLELHPNGLLGPPLGLSTLYKPADNMKMKSCCFSNGCKISKHEFHTYIFSISLYLERDRLRSPCSELCCETS